MKEVDKKNSESIQARLKAEGKLYILDTEDENSEEYAHFYFIGNFANREVLYDAVMYTLRLQHESELFEIAEQRAVKHFPQYKKITSDEENGNLESLGELEEEIGLFMAEVIMELEEDETIKVKEHVDVDSQDSNDIGLDIGLHIAKITSEEIENFINHYNTDTLKLDDTLYSFQTQEDFE